MTQRGENDFRRAVTGSVRRRGAGSTVRWLILIHRCLGIPLSVFFVVWFASGIVMMYTRDMPRLTPELRLERLPAWTSSVLRWRRRLRPGGRTCRRPRGPPRC